MGFALNVTTNTLSRLKPGERAKLFVSESIGETNFDLFGFCDKSEKRCFEMLIGVSGIGPKAALSILSYNSPESLALAILNDDVKALTVAPGIGKKIAQRVILELKDKIGKELGRLAFRARDSRPRRRAAGGEQGPRRRHGGSGRAGLFQRGAGAGAQAHGSHGPGRPGHHQAGAEAVGQSSLKFETPCVNTLFIPPERERNEYQFFPKTPARC